MCRRVDDEVEVALEGEGFDATVAVEGEGKGFSDDDVNAGEENVSLVVSDA